MNRKYRKTVIAGNWKMNAPTGGAKDFIGEIKALCMEAKWCELVLCVPFTHISQAVRTAKGTGVAVGAQNCHFEQKGAFTGEVSCEMLVEAGVKYVIVGHSERRQMFAETDESVNSKIHAALSAGLRPIVCVGESLETRELQAEPEFVACQLKRALKGVSVDLLRRVIIAYEPIWAIGTGKTATSEQANSMCAEIRRCLRELYGARAARSVSILYGGSMNEKNARDLLSLPDVDGGLIGGASLKADAFAEIIRAANQ